MKVLSLFDGISIAQQALKELGIPVESYFASEIDKYAINITQKNFPNTIQLGDITKIDSSFYNRKDYGLQEFDLIIGGSPCQNLSMAGNRKGLEGEKSKLFFEFVRLVKEIKPKYFILENVNSMTKENKDIMSNYLFEIQPVMINSSLVSGQSRERLFWVGKLINGNYEQVEIKQPEDREIYLTDILQEEVDKKYYLTESNIKTINRNFGSKGKTINLDECFSLVEKMTYPSRINQKFGKIKCPTLTAAMGTGGGNIPVIIKNGIYRKLTEIECERLMSLPDNYTSGVAMTQRYKALGNGFNCEVVKHILKNIL
ncbi:MAG TPA: DNA (cytosine-5-)-methyltransferase [Candidatus Cloacimonas acidaminovorans]|nr:DNA (cytosine-5-)-methyltransferase [Candidatus Cloacimonas acidaminovorans]